MNRSRIVSKILFYLSRLLAAVYLVTVLYALLCVLTGWAITSYGEGKYLHINYPFTSRPFLNVDNNNAYIIFSFLLPLTLYGLFFGLTSNVFKVFFQPKLFTQQNIVHLRRFYWFNLLVPASAVFVASLYVPIESVIGALVVVHLILGVFAYFLAAIFKQGVHLQKEQDLFI